VTPAQASPLEKAERNLAAARLLLAQGYPDFATARTYYTMFYAAEALLIGKGLGYSKHAAVIAAFGQHFVKTGELPQETHRWLIECHAERQRGDYDVEATIPTADAERLIAQAAQFLSAARTRLAAASG
jgi:uncharacterized protein (UPF0332 family)